MRSGNDGRPLVAVSQPPSASDSAAPTADDCSSSAGRAREGPRGTLPSSDSGSGVPPGSAYRTQAPGPQPCGGANTVIGASFYSSRPTPCARVLGRVREASTRDPGRSARLRRSKPRSRWRRAVLRSLRRSPGTSVSMTSGGRSSTPRPGRPAIHDAGTQARRRALVLAMSGRTTTAAALIRTRRVRSRPCEHHAVKLDYPHD